MSFKRVKSLIASACVDGLSHATSFIGQRCECAAIQTSQLQHARVQGLTAPPFTVIQLICAIYRVKLGASSRRRQQAAVDQQCLQDNTKARKRRQRDHGLKCAHHGSSMSCRQRLCLICCGKSGQPCCFHAPGTHSSSRSTSSTAGASQQHSSSSPSGSSSPDSRGRLQTAESAPNKQQLSSQQLTGARAVLSILWLCWCAVWAPFRLTKSAVVATVRFILPNIATAAAEADAAASLQAQQAPSLSLFIAHAKRISDSDAQAATFATAIRAKADLEGCTEAEIATETQVAACLLVLCSLSLQFECLHSSYPVPTAVLALCQLVAVQLVLLNTVAVAQHSTLWQLLSSWATLRITAVRRQLCWLFVLLVNGVAGVTMLWVDFTDFCTAYCCPRECRWEWLGSMPPVFWFLVHAALHLVMSVAYLDQACGLGDSHRPFLVGLWQLFTKDLSRLCLLPASANGHTRTVNAYLWVSWFVVRRMGPMCIAHIIVPYLPNATLESMGAAFQAVPAEWMVLLPFWVVLQLHARGLLVRHISKARQAWQHLSVLAASAVVAATTAPRAIARTVLAGTSALQAFGQRCKESLGGRIQALLACGCGSTRAYSSSAGSSSSSSGVLSTQSQTTMVPSSQSLCAAGAGFAGHSECVVCLDAPRSVALLPCGHVVLCGGCFACLQKQAQRLVGKGRLCCPVCRSEVHGHVDGLIVP